MSATTAAESLATGPLRRLRSVDILHEYESKVKKTRLLWLAGLTKAEVEDHTDQLPCARLSQVPNLRQIGGRIRVRSGVQERPKKSGATKKIWI